MDHFWGTFVHLKCKLSSLRSQCWMRLFAVIFKHCENVLFFRYCCDVDRNSRVCGQLFVHNCPWKMQRQLEFSSLTFVFGYHWHVAHHSIGLGNVSFGCICQSWAILVCPDLSLLHPSCKGNHPDLCYLHGSGCSYWTIQVCMDVLPKNKERAVRCGKKPENESSMKD